MVKWLWWLVLSLAAAEDFRSRRISLELLAAGLVFGSVRLTAMIAAGSDVATHLRAFCIGLAMLILSRATRGAIGEGDGLFFLLTACFLNLGETVIFFLASLAVSCLWGICCIAKGLYTGQSRWKESIPFLTCAWLPGLWIIWR